MKIFATSDTHFGHEKLITLSDRPDDFGSRIMKSLKQNSGDLLIHCGDICIGHDDMWVMSYMSAADKFKRKILVRGNHDNKSDKWYLERGFDFVCESFTAKFFGKQMLFSHIPILRNDVFWTPHFPPEINIHGHMHGGGHRGSIPGSDYLYDLAPELHDYKIVNLAHLKAQ